MQGNYFIIHGSFGSPFGNWFSWLRKQLEDRNCEVYTPDFPTGVGYQNYENWSKLLKVYLDAGLINENTTIIGHSIAPIFISKFLVENKVLVKKLIFVCGFNNYLGINEEYDAVNNSMYFDNLSDVKQYAKDIICYYSDNDPYVKFEVEKQFADTIATEKYVINGAGHINAESGYTKFKDILNVLGLGISTEQSVSNIFVLHSLNGDTLRMWGKDVKETFEENIEVIMPEFPIRAESKYEKFRDLLEFYYENGTLNSNSIVIAHSIGNAYFIRFCEEKKFIPKSYIAVAPGAVYEYPSNRTDYIVEVKKQAYVKKHALDYIKQATCDKYCLHSDEDDKNEEKFTRFIEDTDSKGMYLKYYNHFDGYHNIYKIPELISLINELL